MLSPLLFLFSLQVEMINKVVHVRGEDGRCPDGAEAESAAACVCRNTLDWARFPRGE